MATEAGLTPLAAFDVSVALEFADESSLLRRLLSPGPVVEAIEARGEEVVATAVLRPRRPTSRRAARTGSRTSGTR